MVCNLERKLISQYDDMSAINNFSHQNIFGSCKLYLDINHVHNLWRPPDIMYSFVGALNKVQNLKEEGLKDGATHYLDFLRTKTSIFVSV